MKTNPLNFNGRELSSSLGYGILDAASIKFENDVLHANYLFECDGSVVHRITWDKTSCMLETLAHKELVRISRSTELKRVMLTDSSSWSFQTDQTFLFLSEKVSRLGNIYVDHPKPDEDFSSVNYFPAGKLFLFSLPLLKRSPAYEAFLAGIAGNRTLKFFRERNGLLLREDQAHKVSIKPIVIADFVVPIAHLYSAARAFVAAGVIGKEKELRLMVNECFHAEKSFLRAFTGSKEYPHFGICFKELTEDRYNTIKEIFNTQASALRVLQRTA